MFRLLATVALFGGAAAQPDAQCTTYNVCTWVCNCTVYVDPVGPASCMQATPKLMSHRLQMHPATSLKTTVDGSGGRGRGQVAHSDLSVPALFFSSFSTPLPLSSLLLQGSRQVLATKPMIMTSQHPSPEQLEHGSGGRHGRLVSKCLRDTRINRTRTQYPHCTCFFFPPRDRGVQTLRA